MMLKHVHEWKAREAAQVWVCPTCGERKPMTPVQSFRDPAVS